MSARLPPLSPGDLVVLTHVVQDDWTLRNTHIREWMSKAFAARTYTSVSHDQLMMVIEYVVDPTDPWFDDVLVLSPVGHGWLRRDVVEAA